MAQHSFLQNLLNGQALEWQTLGEVCELKRGQTITAKTKKDGNIPVISGGQQPAYYNAEFNREGETITVAGSGAYAGHLLFWNEPIYVSDAFSVKPDLNILNTKYVFHFLLNNQNWIYNLKKGSGVPHVYPKDLAKLQIPIPPLSVQSQIVQILDTFTELTDQLTTELSMRQKQYQYYRDLLLTFDEKISGGRSNPFFCQNVLWKTLGEVGELVRGNGLTKKDLTDDGVPAIHYGQIYTRYGLSTEKTLSFVSTELAKRLRKVDTGDVVITNTSENLADVGKSLVYLGKEQAVTGGHATIFKPNKQIILGKYFAYFTQTDNFATQKRKYAKGTKVIDVSTNDMAKLKIPIPPLSVQSQIVAILDTFDTLVNSISEGLPKEIKLRQKQYEYYRERLLAF